MVSVLPKLTRFDCSRFSNVEVETRQIIQNISPVAAWRIGTCNALSIPPGPWIILKDPSCSIVTNDGSASPGERATLVCEDGIGGGPIGDENSLPGVHLQWSRETFLKVKILV